MKDKFKPSSIVMEALLGLQKNESVRSMPMLPSLNTSQKDTTSKQGKPSESPSKSVLPDKPLEYCGPTEVLLDLARWEPLPDKINRREIFVAQLVTPQERGHFKRRGYTLVDVRTLPRGNPHFDSRALLGWLQGMSEGTIALDKERRAVLEIEVKACGLLEKSNVRVNVNATLTEKTLEQLLTFGPSKFTMKASTTVERLEAARLASVDPVAATVLEGKLS